MNSSLYAAVFLKIRKIPQENDGNADDSGLAIKGGNG
jgi:hypothetical protein